MSTHKISFKLDIGKLKKERIETRKYINADGVEVTQKLYPLELVPLKEAKIVKDADTYQLIKSHFVAEATTKAEREAGYKGAILADGLYIRGKEQPQPEPALPDYPTDEINPEDIPF